jgi:predicted nucleotide-binding protein
VSGVRTGKAIRFSIDAEGEAAARDEVDELCRRFLTNPVIEDARVTLAEETIDPVAVAVEAVAVEAVAVEAVAVEAVAVEAVD